MARSLPRVGVPLRVRLTVWYGALLALSLVGFSMLVYVTLERSLSMGVDEQLRFRGEQIRRALGTDVGRLVQPEDINPGSMERGPLAEFAAPGIYVQVINPRGRVVAAPVNLAGGELPIHQDSLGALREGTERMVDVPVGGTNVRVLTVPLTSGDRVVGAVQVGQSLSPLENTMAAVGRQVSLASVAILVLAVVVGWLLTHRALNPLARVTSTARHIATTGDYSRRLPVLPRPSVGRADELYVLSSTFNDMTSRLEQLLDSQRRLLADTSHELRNPLTVIRGNLSVLRGTAPLPAEMRAEAVQEAEEEAARMARLIDDLLLLARADTGQLPSIRREPVDLGALAHDVMEQARPRAGARRLEVRAAEPVLVLGDYDRLKQVVANLVWNALRYTPDDGSIRVTVRAETGARLASTAPLQHLDSQNRLHSTKMPDEATEAAVLEVEDTGVGIEAEHLPHLFERFYRVDRARSRTEGGTGLGLSIAQYIAQAHGGHVEAHSDGAGRGSRFTLRAPRYVAAAVAASEPDGAEPTMRLRRRLARPHSAPRLAAASGPGQGRSTEA